MELHTGHHLVEQWFGLTVNADTIYVTWGVSLFLIIVFLLATRKRSMVPSGIQNFMEFVVEVLLDPMKETLGEKYAYVCSVLFTIFFYLIISNELGMVPTLETVSSPSNDINTAAALAIASSVVVWVTGIRLRGGHYLAHFFKPFAPFVIMNAIEEVTKPLTLAFRLFGNILAGEIMLEVLYHLVPWFVPIVWIGFSLIIGLIQAYVFTLLTTAYLSMALNEEE